MSFTAPGPCLNIESPEPCPGHPLTKSQVHSQRKQAHCPAAQLQWSDAGMLTMLSLPWHVLFAGFFLLQPSL